MTEIEANECEVSSNCDTQGEVGKKWYLQRKIIVGSVLAIIVFIIISVAVGLSTSPTKKTTQSSEQPTSELFEKIVLPVRRDDCLYVEENANENRRYQCSRSEPFFLDSFNAKFVAISFCEDPNQGCDDCAFVAPGLGRCNFCESHVISGYKISYKYDCSNIDEKATNGFLDRSNGGPEDLHCMNGECTFDDTFKLYGYDGEFELELVECKAVEDDASGAGFSVLDCICRIIANGMKECNSCALSSANASFVVFDYDCTNIASDAIATSEPWSYKPLHPTPSPTRRPTLSPKSPTTHPPLPSSRPVSSGVQPTMNPVPSTPSSDLPRYSCSLVTDSGSPYFGSYMCRYNRFPFPLSQDPSMFYMICNTNEFFEPTQDICPFCAVVLPLSDGSRLACKSCILPLPDFFPENGIPKPAFDCLDLSFLISGPCVGWDRNGCIENVDQQQGGGGSSQVMEADMYNDLFSEILGNFP